MLKILQREVLPEPMFGQAVFSSRHRVLLHCSKGSMCKCMLAQKSPFKNFSSLHAFVFELISHLLQSIYAPKKLAKPTNIKHTL